MPVAQIDGATWRKFYDDIGLHIRETLTVAEDSTGTTLLELTTLASALRLVRGQMRFIDSTLTTSQVDKL